MKNNVVIYWSILIIFVSNFSCSVYIFLDISLYNWPLNFSHFPVDQWFNNSTTQTSTCREIKEMRNEYILLSLINWFYLHHNFFAYNNKYCWIKKQLLPCSSGLIYFLLETITFWFNNFRTIQLLARWILEYSQL